MAVLEELGGGYFSDYVIGVSPPALSPCASSWMWRRAFYGLMAKMGLA